MQRVVGVHLIGFVRPPFVLGVVGVGLVSMVVVGAGVVLHRRLGGGGGGVEWIDLVFREWVASSRTGSGSARLGDGRSVDTRNQAIEHCLRPLLG